MRTVGSLLTDRTTLWFSLWTISYIERDASARKASGVIKSYLDICGRLFGLIYCIWSLAAHAPRLHEGYL